MSVLLEDPPTEEELRLGDHLREMGFRDGMPGYLCFVEELGGTSRWVGSELGFDSQKGAQVGVGYRAGWQGIRFSPGLYPHRDDNIQPSYWHGDTLPQLLCIQSVHVPVGCCGVHRRGDRVLTVEQAVDVLLTVPNGYEPPTLTMDTGHGVEGIWVFDGGPWELRTKAQRAEAADMQYDLVRSYAKRHGLHLWPELPSLVYPTPKV